MNNSNTTILNIEREKLLLENQIANWFDTTKKHIETVPIELNAQVQLLANMRQDLYEELNQLQHAAFIIKVAEKLQIEFPQINKWCWHAKQTSHPDFADLTGYVGDNIFLNAEVTTSLKPVGTIDKRIKSTLASLDKKQGLKLYFVLTNEMFSRAISKKTNNDFDIEIRQL